MAWLSSLAARAIVGALVIMVSTPATRGLAQVFPVCSWPFESTGRGLTNVATPDTHATYWVMPFDTGRWKAMLIHGMYPAARFFNFSSYTETGAIVDSIIDSKIAPDNGSTNPFATPTTSAAKNYTLTIGTGTSAALHVGATRLAFIVYRVYAPTQGFDRTGGVGVPAVSLIANDGSSHDLRSCPFADAETSLGNMVISLAINGFTDGANFLQGLLMLANQHPLNTVGCNPAQPGPASVAFASATLGTNFFSNPQTTYLETAALCFQPSEVLVVRGKAPVFPNTYVGGSVFQPAFDGQIQLRYWSMCNNEGVIPYPVVACAADFETRLEPDQFYTYVISNDPAPPTWLPAGATWLPWGSVAVPKRLIFRNISTDNSQLGADYLPRGAFCDQATVAQRGWEFCFAAAGVR